MDDAEILRSTDVHTFAATYLLEVADIGEYNVGTNRRIRA
jgi:hypothetical protein